MSGTHNSHEGHRAGIGETVKAEGRYGRWSAKVSPKDAPECLQGYASREGVSQTDT